jgi:hypothetical protein
MGLLDTFSPSNRMASIEHEFSILERARKRKEHLQRIENERGSGYGGPPVVDFMDVVKQGLRTKPLRQNVRNDIVGRMMSEGASEGEIKRGLRFSELTPSDIRYDDLPQKDRKGQHEWPIDRVTVDPNEHKIFDPAGKGPFEGTDLIETEMHELSHRVSQSILRDPFFIELYEESQKKDGRKLLAGFYKKGEDGFVRLSGEGVTKKKDGSTNNLMSREHQMIRAATEGSDPTVPWEYRTVARKDHTPKAIQDAKDFNELVREYARRRRLRGLSGGILSDPNTSEGLLNK